ncbi:hypothetical protein ABT246_24535 [Streptomyces sp. NPDC001553]|uniref:hypothetical protein n=1 Tax=Streptomyces sp. NPDC001553 TaxID=3154385 RepID=UPI00331B906E
MITNPAQSRHGLPDWIGLWRVGTATRNSDWWMAYCSRHGPGPHAITDKRTSEWDIAELARIHNEQHHRDPKPEDLLTDEQIEAARQFPISDAQHTVLHWVAAGKVAEYADGFFALDIAPDKHDVNKKLSRTRVITLWCAGLLNIDSIGQPVGRREFTLSTEGRTVYTLWQRAKRQGHTTCADRDHAFAIPARQRADYPLLSAGRSFAHEQPDTNTNTPNKESQ